MCYAEHHGNQSRHVVTAVQLTWHMNNSLGHNTPLGLMRPGQLIFGTLLLGTRPGAKLNQSSIFFKLTEKLV